MAGGAHPETGVETVDPGLVRLGDGQLRCGWCTPDPRYVAYHDEEWGRPVADERALYEKLCLEAFQAGLSWLTILRRRAALRTAFAGFHIETVAGYGPGDVERLLADTGIIRNRAKIEAAIANARAVSRLHDRGGSLTELAWSHAPAPRPRPTSPDQVPAWSDGSIALARALKRAGFIFVGPTTAYAFQQAMGMIDDHLEGCWVPPDATGPRAGVSWDLG